VVYARNYWRSIAVSMLTLTRRYWAFKNSQSMDGLPGMKRGVETAKREDVKPIKKMVGPYAKALYDGQKKNSRSVSMRYLVLLTLLSFFMGVSAAVLGSPQLGYLQMEGLRS